MRSPILLGWFLYASQSKTADALMRDCYPNATANKTAAGCYDSLRDIAIAMEEKDPFQFETFALCPNKEYKIGNRDRNQPLCFRDGDAMLELRQFSTVQCGVDGSSNNNCTITGGFNQMATTAGSYSVEPKTRIEVAGITFAQGRGGALFLAAGGDVTFKDCIFMDHVNDGTIKIVFQAFDDDGVERRTLQPVDTNSVSVTFDHCLFDSNRYPGGVPFGLRQLGVINMRASGGTLNIENSVFRDNDFVTDFDFDTYLVNVEPGNVLNMKNNCFYSNLLEGRGLVHLDAVESLGSIESNAGIGHDPMLTDCDFLHVDDVDANTTCIGFDATTCSVTAPVSSDKTLETGEGCSSKSECSFASSSRGFGWVFVSALAHAVMFAYA